MTKVHITISPTALTLLTMLSAVAADWSAWRGCDGNGTATSPPLAATWPAEGPKQVWQWDFPDHRPPKDGYSHSSPIIVGDRVFVFAPVSSRPLTEKKKEWGKLGTVFRDSLFCLDRTTGKELWQVQLPAPIQGWGPSATPCFTDGVVIASGANNRPFAVDAESGELLWRWKGGLGGGGYGFHASPAAANGIVVVPTRGKGLMALNARTGKFVWTQKTGRRGNDSPVIWRAGDKTLVLAGPTCLDLKTGASLWKLENAGLGSPVLVGDILLTRHKQHGRDKKFDYVYVAHQVTPKGAKELWRHRTVSNSNSPLVAGRLVYYIKKKGAPLADGGKAVDNTLCCVDLDTKEERWHVPLMFPTPKDKQKLRKPGGRSLLNLYSSPILVDGKIIFTNHFGSAMIDAETGKILATCLLPSAPYPSPAFKDGMLVVRCLNSVRAYDLRR